MKIGLYSVVQNRINFTLFKTDISQKWDNMNLIENFRNHDILGGCGEGDIKIDVFKHVCPKRATVSVFKNTETVALLGQTVIF